LPKSPATQYLKSPQRTCPGPSERPKRPEIRIIERIQTFLSDKLLDELKAIFNQYHKDGTVTLEYDTAILYGQLSA